MTDQTAQVKKLRKQLYVDYGKGIVLLGVLEALIIALMVRFVVYILSTDRIIVAFYTPITQPIPSTIWIPVLVGLIVFTVMFARRVLAYKTAFVEKHMPAFSQIYSTTSQTLDQDTIVSKALQEDMLKLATQTSSLGLIQPRRIMRRVWMFILVAGLFVITPFTLSVIEDMPQIDAVRSWIDDRFRQPDQQHSLPPISYGDVESLYGESRTIAQGNTTLSLSVDRGRGGSVDVLQPMAWQHEWSSSVVGTHRTDQGVIEAVAPEPLPDEYALAQAYNLKIRSLQ